MGGYRYRNLIEGLYTLYRSPIEGLYTLNSPPVVSLNFGGAYESVCDRFERVGSSWGSGSSAPMLLPGDPKTLLL